jgi:cobalt-precorrin 5A hydrolase
MKLAAVVLNEEGLQMISDIQSRLGEVDIFAPENLAVKSDQFLSYSSLNECVNKIFNAYEGLIFVMAAGIVVRAIAPYIKDKYSDPAVVVVDRKAHYAISLLGGHSAGANKLAEKISEATGAKAIITTAFPISPKSNVAAGLGCRRGVTKEELMEAISKALKTVGLNLSCLKKIGSIDIKKDEAALKQIVSDLKIPLDFYNKDDLADVKYPSSSTFVKTKTGVESVCEPAAILAAGKGELILPKTKFGRVTVALAKVESQ